jgi:hypothetical protein
LEALRPQQLQKYLDEAIRSVIDIDLFNAEVEAEENEKSELDIYRERAIQAIQSEREATP